VRLWEWMYNYAVYVVFVLDSMQIVFGTSLERGINFMPMRLCDIGISGLVVTLHSMGSDNNS
jgi:hypothetical protein